MNTTTASVKIQEPAAPVVASILTEKTPTLSKSSDSSGTSPESSENYKQRIRKTTSREIAADQLECALSSTFFDLHLALMYIEDAALVESVDLLHVRAVMLVRDGDKLDERIDRAYPCCHGGGASHLLRGRPFTLAQEVEFYRQEKFWRQEGHDPLIASEELIRDIYRFFRAAAEFLRSIDETNDHTRHERTLPTFRACPNPYEEIIGD